MAYSPITDFLALLRRTPNGDRLAQVPGLDYVVAAMARAGMFLLSVSQTAPQTNQSTTVWLRPAQPSWSAEGAVYLWNAATGEYELATPALWSAFATPGYQFQAATAPTNVVQTGVSLLAIERVAPAATTLVLPPLVAQWLTTRELRIADWSTGVANHVITLATPDGATIMKQATWTMLSTPDQLAGLRLSPSPDLNAWIVAP